MTARSNRGGRIPPDGRTPQARGVGSNAKRHDLERPSTPGLHGSDLQQGDVSDLRQAQAIAPRAGAKQVQRPATNRPTQTNQAPTASPGGGPVEVPAALDFAKGRLGGTLGRASSGVPQSVDVSGWLPLLRQMASNPTSGGTLTRAYIDLLTRLSRAPATGVAAIDVTALDDAVEQGILDG